MKSLTLATMVLFTLTGVAFAQAPARVPVHLSLTDSSGEALSGQHQITLALYSGAVAGTALFEETHTVTLTDGAVALELGDEQTLDLALFAGGGLFLGIRVGTDAEMTPRLALGSAPYAGFAQRAGEALNVQGLAPADLRLSADPIVWADIDNVPAGVTDGDDDSLAALSCNDGDVVGYSGGAWQCAPAAGPHSHPFTELTDVPADLADGDDVGVSGSGTAGILPMFSASDALADSVVVQDASGRIGIGVTPAVDELEVGGACRCSTFRSDAGSFPVAPGATETTTLTFDRRSVYLVKASWSGGMMEGTRAWYVLTQHDFNQYTGHPSVIDLGMTTGSYHYSDTLTLAQDASLPYNQLELGCNRVTGSDTRSCLWSITRLAYQ